MSMMTRLCGWVAAPFFIAGFVLLALGIFIEYLGEPDDGKSRWLEVMPKRES